MTFHPQADGQIEVINQMIVHILHMYNSKHPRTRDESLPYVQHSYKRALHNSTDHNPFQVGLGFQPLGPIDVALPLAVTSNDSSPSPTEVDKATQFIELIQHIHQQVQDILQKSNDKYKQCHDQHQVPHKFQVGDKVWLHCRNNTLQDPIGSFAHSVMGRTPSPRSWGIMLLSSTFLLSLACTQCSTWISFALISHHYWTPQTVEEQLTPTELNPDCIQQASNDQIVDTQIKGTR
jgi:hypothetical protein